MGAIQTEIIVAVFFFGIVVTLFIVGLLIQRTRHNRAQEVLSRSEKRYLLALESSTDGLWDWHIPSGAVVYSDRFRKILGVSIEEFPDTIASFRNRLHPEDADTTWIAIKHHLKERIPLDVECRLRSKAGTYLWFTARGQAIWDSAGKAVQMSGWIQDITERKQAELNLRAALSEIKQLKDLLEAERAYLQEEIKSAYNHENIIGQSDEINYVLYIVNPRST